MLTAVLLTAAGIIAALTVVDRVLAIVVVTRVSRRIAAVSKARSVPSVRLSAPLLTQLIAGVYRDVQISVPAVAIGDIEFIDATAALAQVRAPLGRLLAGGGLVAGQVTATATVPFLALGDRLPPGVSVSQHRGELRVTGSVLRVQVSGMLGVRSEPQRIVLTPKVAGIPALVSFVLALPGMPPELTIRSVLVTDRGLEVTVAGYDVWLAPKEQQSSATGGPIGPTRSRQR